MTKRQNEKHITNSFDRIADFQLPKSAVKRDIENVRKMLDGQESKVSLRRQNLWRTIMTSKWTKYATAAMVLIAIILGLNFMAVSELSAAEILTKVAENMADMKWRKSVSKTYLPGKDEPVDITTTMTDYKNKQCFRIHGKGYLHQIDYDKMTWSVYRPEDNTMIVKPLKGEWHDPDTQVNQYVEKLKSEGLETTLSDVVRDGVKLTVIEFDETLNNLSHEPDKYMSKMRFGGKTVKIIHTKLVINTKLLRFGSAEISYIDPEDSLIATIKSESQQIDTGPSDIYELGVPDDVKIINKVPDKQVMQLHEKIDQQRSDFIKDYVAVQIETDVSEGKERLVRARVIHSQGKKLRVDVFLKRYGADDGAIADRSELLAVTLDRLKDYWPQEDLELYQVDIYDGLWLHTLAKSGDGIVLRKPQRRPDGDANSDDDLDDFGWRKLWWLNEPVHMYEDDFSKENGFIATEICPQFNGYLLPKRQVLYVDPAKDYLAARYVNEELLDAPWQKEPIDPNEIKTKSHLEEEVRVRDITEYGQTSGGKWYPKTITIKGYDRAMRDGHRGDYKRDFDRVSRIYLLEENPQLPDEIFDPARLK